MSRHVSARKLCQDHQPHHIVVFKSPRDQLGIKNLLLQAFPNRWKDVMDVFDKATRRPFGTRNFLTTDFLKYRKYGKKSNLTNVSLLLLNLLANICNTPCHIDQQSSHIRQK